MNALLEHVRSLEAEVERHNLAYYKNASSEITDVEYDRLVAELKELESAHPELASPNSPLRRVGSDLSEGFAKVAHSQPMLSLENTYNQDEAREFLTGIMGKLGERELFYVVEPKVDGLAIACRYRDGEFVQALTRGDGQTGDDVTANVRALCNLPLFIPDGSPLLAERDVELRGEIYMPLERFEALNQELEERGEDLLANPRNAASGALKSHSPARVRERGLHVVFHGADSRTLDRYRTYLEFLRAVEASGFPVLDRVVPEMGSGLDSGERLVICLKWLEEKSRDMPFPVDGCVVKLDDLGHRRFLGEHRKAPRWAFAFKFEPEEARTILRDVTLQVGRTGAVVPVAELEPVKLDGTTVSRATLHNFEDIARKGIRVGDTVGVVKAGEIIPAVTRVYASAEGAADIVAPKRCPSCNSDLVLDGAHHYCRSNDCPAKNQQAFEHFVGRDAMNIQHLGPSQIRKLLESGLLKSFYSFYRMTREDLLAVPGFREAGADRILDEIHRSRQAGPDRLLYAHGVRHVGRTASKAILRRYDGNLRRAVTATREELLGIDGIGDVIADSFLRFCASQVFDWVDQWSDLGVVVYRPLSWETPAGTSGVAGETWVITGTLTRDRSYYQRILEDAGARVTGSVSKKTNYLLVGEAPGKSKTTAAANHGVPTVDEAGFLARLGIEGSL